eukprot:6478653-Amphidinium_carterae.1
MVDKSSVMKMLLHVLDVETETCIQTEQWQEELTASGACSASGVVDVKHFVAFCLQRRLTRVLRRNQNRAMGVVKTAADDLMAAINTNQESPSNPSGSDMNSSSWTLSTAVIGKQSPLPSPEDQTGAVVVMGSKQYVLGKRLGQGAGGSVFASTLLRAAADAHAVGNEGADSHDPESMALKLVGG